MATLLQTLLNNESGGRNIPNVTEGTDSGQAQGYFQITTGTWTEFAKKAGIDINKYPTPMTAADGSPVPYSVQAAVASTIPLKRWAPSTVALMQQTGKPVDPNKTLGENLSANGEVFDEKATASQNALPTPQTGDYKIAREDTPSYAKPGSDQFKLPTYSGLGGQDSPSEGAGHFGGTGLGTPPIATAKADEKKSSPWAGGGDMPPIPQQPAYQLTPQPAATVAKAQAAPMVNVEQQQAQRQQLAQLLAQLNAPLQQRQA